MNGSKSETTFCRKKHYGWKKKKITEKEEWLKQEIFGQKGENDEDWMRKNNKNKQEYGEKYLGKDKESDWMAYNEPLPTPRVADKG